MTRVFPDKITRSMRTTFCLLTAVILLLGFSQPSKAITSDYTSMGTSNNSAFIIDGVTITGSNDVRILNFNGLGIVGGFSDTAIDFQNAEFIDFSFSAPAVNVSYSVSGAGQDASSPLANGFVGERILEAFAVGGSSLGSVFQNSVGLFDVSTLFGSVAIESFRLSADTNSADFFRVASLTFDTAAVSAVPVPAALPLFGTGLAVMGFVGWRRKQKTSVA